MKELVVDYLQNILSDVSYDVRSGRRLISLIGILGQGGVPEDVQAEALKLSRFIVLRELFTALIEPISSLAKKREMLPVERQMAPSEIDLTQLFQQINETRMQIADYDAINYPLMISWVMAQARAQKFLKSR
ncbi:MAG: hypothetical protein Q8K61_06260 [Gallionella sp.]|nr:hypothetical protein [Gallionella sp.]